MSPLLPGPSLIQASAASGGWPVREYIVGINPAKANSTFNNLSTPNVAGPSPWGSVYSDNTNGSWREWYVALAAGTYALSLNTVLYDGSGIIEFSLNGTVITGAPYNASAATADTYNAGTVILFDFQITSNITIPTSGVYTLRATINGKNASSTGFATNISSIYLGMVAAA